MYEVEVKVPADHGAVRERLDAIGAESLGTVHQADTYYDAPHRDFAETDEAVRIRREETAGELHVELTYKGPKVDAESKTREEIEVAVEGGAHGESGVDVESGAYDESGADVENGTHVESGADVDAFLRALGFSEAAVVEKVRDRYRIDEYTVVLDEVDGVGEFVEVETKAKAVEAAREGAYEILDRLDLDPDDQIRTSYLGLLLNNARK